MDAIDIATNETERRLSQRFNQQTRAAQAKHGSMLELQRASRARAPLV